MHHDALHFNRSKPRRGARRVVLHRIRDTHTILADHWRHETRAYPTWGGASKDWRAARHRVKGESVARSSYGRVPLELNGRVGKGALCAPCPPFATDRVGTFRDCWIVRMRGR